MSLKGIDVSSHNGIINWSKVKNTDIKFAIIRAGYGGGNIDKQFKYNISECNRLNIPCGVYWFSYANSIEDAKNEALSCIKLIKPYKIDYPVCFDFEYDSVNNLKNYGITPTPTIINAYAETFLKEIEKAGYYAMLYTNKDYYNKYFKDLAKRFDVWYAQYSSKRDIECGIWQKSSVGIVDGIKTAVDMNISYKDYPTIIKSKNKGELVKTNELNSTNYLEYVKVAFDVTTGKYGNGIDRKEKITKEGYNYDTVQSIVNIIVQYG